MARETHSPMMQCGECSMLFLQFVKKTLGDYTYEFCPNPRCNAARNMADPIIEGAVGWAFNHILAHSGISETRRMNLRNIAESQMGEWDNLYRSF